MIILRFCFTETQLTHAEQHLFGLSIRDSLIRDFLPELTSPEFAALKSGKPYLLNSDAAYSISHTDGCIMCALKCHTYTCELPPPLTDIIRSDGTYLAESCDSHGEIGCDVEIWSQDRSESRLISISDRYFTEDETALLKSSNNIKRNFYKLWTEKESVLKCCGAGLSGLSRADTSEFSTKYKIYSFEIEQGERKYSASICSEL